MFLDNNGLIADKERAKKLSFMDKMVLPGTVFIVCVAATLAVGMLEGKYGIPAQLQFIEHSFSL